MDTEAEAFDEAVEEVQTLIEAIGYEETQVCELEEPSDNGTDAEGDELAPREKVILASAQAGPNFVVFATESERSFRLQSSYALWRDLADALPDEKIEEYVSDDLREEIPEDHPVRLAVHPEELEEDQERKLAILAAFEILDQANNQIRKELVYQLSDMFTSAEVKHIVDSPTEEGVPHGFTVYTRIFPYEEDGLRIRDLNESIEQVRMASHRATLFMRYAFNLGVDITRTTTGSIGGSPEIPSRDLSPEEIADEHFLK